MKSFGFVLLDKPSGETSFKALFPLKRLFQTRRVGHAGTLDLKASGLIVSAIGRATRLLPHVEAIDKTYTFTLHLGYETETLEWDSPVLYQDSPREFSAREVEAILPSFLGEQLQIPPSYSAIKINGTRASDLVHRGKEIQLAPRPVTIHSLRLLREETSKKSSGNSYAAFSFLCECSKGTYIRALGRDLGRALHTHASVSDIRRISIGDISVEKAFSPEELTLDSLLSPEEILPYPIVNLSEDSIKILRNGCSIPWDFSFVDTCEESFLFAADEKNETRALVKRKGDKIFPHIYLSSD